jgi:hypothetical protein
MSNLYGLSLVRLRQLAAIAALLWVGWVLYRTPSAAIREAALSAENALFIGGWLLLACGVCLGWWLVLRTFAGISPPARTLIESQGWAWLGRYLPGKAGLVLAKLEICTRAGLSQRAALGLIALEQVAFVSGGLVVCGIGLWITPAESVPLLAERPFERLLLVLGLLIVGLTAAPLATLAISRFSARAIQQPGLRAWMSLLLLYSGLHVLIGLCAVPLLTHEAPEVATRLGPMGITGALAFAHVGGIAALIFPAGIGVREAAWGLFADGAPEARQLIQLAVTLRLSATLADIAFFAGSLALGRVLRSSR